MLDELISATQLLPTGADPNFADQRGVTALMTAATAGHLAAVEQLLDNGANPHAVDSIGRTALIYAAHYGHLEIVRALLQRGADVHTTDDCNWTALYAAAYEGHLTIVELLLEHHADVNVMTRMGWPPIFAAIQRAHSDIITLLLDHGAATDLVIQTYPSIQNTQTIFKLCVLHAAEKGLQAMMSRLIEKQPDALYQHINTSIYGVAIHAAVTRNQLEMVRYLLQHGASLEQTDLFEETAIFKALKPTHGALLEFLIAQGALINAKTNEGNTPLHAAVRGCHNEAMERLLRHHACTTVTNNNNITPFELSLTTDNPVATMRLGRLEPVKTLRLALLRFNFASESFNTRRAVLKELIQAKEPMTLWDQHASHPNFNNVLRLANVSLFATCKNPTEQTGLPLDILHQIGKHQLDDFDDAYRFVKVIERHHL